MKTKGLLAWICCIVLLLCMLPVNVLAASTPPSQAGERKLEGGQRDFRWPVPGKYNLTSCYLDNRGHYSLDIDGNTGDRVIASYAGTVISVDTSNQTTGWGNYVLLEHLYTLSTGGQVTMFSRYAHLDTVLVSIGDTVTKGQQIGTVGNTGTSTGSHLDFDIMYGSTSVSVDPYINELLELPDDLYTTGGWCCQEYVTYIKGLYDACSHERYDSKGNCTDCGVAFNWASTKDTSAMGTYMVSVQTTGCSAPYAAATTGTTLSVGQEVSVSARVKNAFGQAWYEVSLSDTKVYVPVSALKLAEYMESKITGVLTSLYEGQTLKAQSHRLDGVITSNYPLKRVTGYLDGQWYASWEGNTLELNLGYTNLNHYLLFSQMTPGKHVLRIVAVDSAHWEEVEVISCTFYIEGETGTVQNNVITYVMEPENQVISLTPGQALGTLPLLSKEGADFLGWFTMPEGGEAVTENTVPTSNMMLYPQWEMLYYTIYIEQTELMVPYGGFITEFPEVSKEGYEFIGWFTIDGEQVTENTPITGDMMLYPRWEIEKTWLTLDAGAGRVDPAQIPVEYGQPYGELPVPVREGYVFKGWRLRGQTITADTIVSVEGGHTAVAVWEKDTSKDSNPVIVIVIVIVMILAVAGIGVLWWLRHRYDDDEWM